MSGGLTAGTITDAQIRALRERYGEGKRAWDPVIVHDCDLALGDVLFDDIGRVQSMYQARERCAKHFDAKGMK